MLQMMQQNIGYTTGSTAKQMGVQKWLGVAIAMAFLPTLTGCGSGAVSSPAATPLPITVTPASLEMSPGIPRTFIVAGGTPPYAVAVNNPAVFATPTVSGASFTLLPKPVSIDTIVDVTVRDAATTAPATAILTVKPTVFSVLPSAAVSVTGASGVVVGQVGDCPKDTAINYYIFGGQPPYSVFSPLITFLSVPPDTVTKSGGSFMVTVKDCGKASLIISDNFGTRLETASIEGLRGAVGTAVVTPFSVTPTVLSIACGAADSVKLAGSGDFSANANVNTTNATSNFIVTPSSGKLPATVSIGVRSGTNVVNSPVEVEFINTSDAAATKPRVTALVTVTGRTSAGICP